MRKMDWTGMFSISKWGYIITRRSAAEIQVKLFWLAEVQKFVQPKPRVPHLTLALMIVATTFVGDILVRANKKNRWAVLKYIYPKLLVGCLKPQYVGACSPKYPCFCWCDSICCDMLWFKCHWFASQIQIWFLQSPEFQVRLVFFSLDPIAVRNFRCPTPFWSWVQ